MNPTWYIAVDMQLFIVSPLFIYPLWRSRKWGLAWLAAVVLACHAFIFYLYVRDDLPPNYVATRPYIRKT
jgi:peptidoglycan/LPS O-acetylase OafA/YrhL